MKRCKGLIVMMLLLFLITACSHIGEEEDHYYKLIDSIRDIEVSINQLFNLNITFDDYRRAFSNKFIDGIIEEKYVRENDFLFSIRENDESKLISRGQLDQEMITKLKSIINKESFSSLRKLNFSKAYDCEDKRTIYVKNTYEYSVCKNRPNGKVKADRVLKIFHFVKKGSQWRIISMEEMHQESLCENERGTFDWVVNTSVFHEGAEIEYVTSFEKFKDQYIERESYFLELSIEERREKLGALEGKDISIGKLLEEVFPEVYYSLGENEKEISNQT